ncbi:MAG: tandem-95 repeat protein [Planctomycetales bacterium]|nr:tandem-95 repeat protein [Planctomycetales bacterium]
MFRRGRRVNCAFSEQLEARRLLAGDLIAHWQADSLTDSIAIDQTIPAWVDGVKQVTAKASGAPLLRAGAGGRAFVELDPTDDVDGFRISESDSPLAGANDFSVVVTFQTDSQQAGGNAEWYRNTAIVDSSALGFTTDWGISINSEGRISAGMGESFLVDSQTLYSDASGLHDGGLHTIAVVRDDNSLSIYVDGMSSGKSESMSKLPRHSQDVVIGMTLANASGFTGLIGDIRFYDGALNDQEISVLTDELSEYYNNQPPVAVADRYVAQEDAPLLVPVTSGVLANDTDAESDDITAELVQPPSNGQLNLQADGSFAYVPDKDFVGIDSFQYVAADHQRSGPATVELVVENTYDPAFAVSDSYKLRPGQATTIPAFVGVLSNDVNPDGADLKAVLVSNVDGGQLTLNDDGSFRFDPLDFSGATRFSYQIDDGTRLSFPATVDLIVNSAPVANDDNLVITEDTPLVVTALDGVLANDIDAEGDALTVRILEAPSHGVIATDEDGTLVFEPELDYFGPDLFTYSVSDAHDTSSAATVLLQIEAVNDSPQANADVYFVAGGETLDVDVSRGLLANDFDVDSQDLSVTLSRAAANGSVSINADGSSTYVPNAEFTGQDSFGYRTSDGNSSSTDIEVAIYVGTAPMRISELAATNIGLLETRLRDDPDGRFRGSRSYPDWIEIENLTDADFDIAGFTLSDSPSNIRSWQFPDGSVVSANGRLLVFASGLNVTDSRLDENGSMHTDFTLSIKPSSLVLGFPDGRVAQSIDYPAQVPGVSYGMTSRGDFGFLFDSTPGEINSEQHFAEVASPVDFSVERGFYEEAFEVGLSTETANAIIRYTLDGSAPTADTGIVYTTPVSVSTTTTLRAAAFKANSVPSEVTTNSYFFLADVIEQPFQREGYPDRWAGMPADYGMDPDVVGVDNLFNDIYRNSVIDDLMTLPTLSLSFAVDDMFGSSGIYQRPTTTGDGSERPVSIEYIPNSDSEPGFHLNSGIRIMGGSSRQPDIPKHSFRLEFREAYGAGKLEYPLFDNDPFAAGVTDSFDELVVRVGFNNSWMHRHYYQSLRGEQPRDQWVRDMHMAMGNPGARGHYVHVYLNGLYWGIYNLHERPAAPFMEEYFGGDKDTEWNVINSNEAIDGEVRPWSQVLAMANRGLSEDDQYAAFEAEVDTTNLADYMLLNFYIGNTDWDGHNWISARRNTDDKWHFYAWDSEFAISLPPSNSAIAEDAERQIINMDRTTQNSGNGPSRLHTRAAQNEEYALLFADRVHKHMFNGGTLTPETATHLFLQRSAEIDRAVVAESARWGDFRRDVNPGNWRSDQFDLYHRDEHYVDQRDFITERYLTVRTGIVLEQLRRRRLYPDIVAPAFNQHGGKVPENFSLSMNAPAGTIYYTTDGSDPRLRGGDVSPSAVVFDKAVNLARSANVKARVLVDGEWSALNEADFKISTPASSDNLRITEVNYHPAPATEAEKAAGITDADEFEYIEFLNISDSPIDLTEVALARVAAAENDEQGVDFVFAEGDVLELQPNERVLVVENRNAFSLRYGADILVAGQWSGQLGNGGEMITVFAGETILQQFTYDDEWYASTDGGGSSLEIIDAAAALEEWDNSDSWRPSKPNGSPGEDDLRIPGDSNGDGIFNSSDFVLVFQAGEYEDNIEGNSTFEEGDWDGDGDFTTNDFVFAFQFGQYNRE